MDIHDDERPWGNERWFVESQPVTVKILTVRAGEEFSLQYHNHRDEFWRILSGSPTVHIDGRVETAHPGDEFFVERTKSHRISAEDEDATILEIAFGDFDEADIVHLEDKYHRP